MIKKIWSFLYGINGIILIVYTFFVLGTYIVTSKLDLSIKYSIRWLFILLIALVIVCPYILKRLNRVTIKCRENPISNEISIRFFFAFFIIAMMVFLIYWAGYYPGGFYGDQMGQYGQAISNNYDDWHPAFHTLLVYKLPLLLTFGWTGSIILFQIIAFSTAISYAAFALLKHTNKTVAFCYLGIVLLNPSTGNTAMQPTKDATFSIGTLFLVTFAFLIVCSKKRWLSKFRHIIALIVVLSITTLVRHNAMLFTVPYLIAVILYMSKKKAIISIVSFIMIIVMVKGPLYSALNVGGVGKRQVETLGLPMTVIGAVVTNDPESLDAEVLKFAYKVAPKEVWEENYAYGDFNHVKWDPRSNNKVIEEYGAGKVLRYMMSAFSANPRAAIQGLIKLTDPVYTVTDDYSYYETLGAADNEYGIHWTGVEMIRSANNRYTGAVSMMFPHLFMYVGSMMLLLIVSVLSKCKLNSKKDWKKILFAIPILAYNFGTMLLLTGASDSSRFFYYSFITVPILIVLFYLNGNNSNQSFS